MRLMVVFRRGNDQSPTDSSAYSSRYSNRVTSGEYGTVRRITVTVELGGGASSENMRRLGHRTFKAAMLYQHAYDDSGKKLAADLSAHALAELSPAD